MKVYQLIWRLLRCNPTDMVVIEQNDSASPLDGVDTGNYEENTKWSGDIRLRSLTKEDRKSGYTEEDVGSGEDCVVLCPIN